MLAVLSGNSKDEALGSAAWSARPLVRSDTVACLLQGALPDCASLCVAWAASVSVPFASSALCFSNLSAGLFLQREGVFWAAPLT